MKRIALDPSYGSENLGDHVIREAIQGEIDSVADLQRIPTHSRPQISEVLAARRSARIYALGSNLLTSTFHRHRQWLVTPDLVASYRKKVRLIGVGWWQYQQDPNPYSRWVMSEILDREVTHSCRDTYTADRLAGIGFRVRMTSCPTMWSLKEVSPMINLNQIAATITDYKRDPSADSVWLSDLASVSESVKLISMAPADVQYAKTLDLPENVESVALKAGATAELNTILGESDCFVGTRLHAGIRAIQLGLPAVILGVDNRAQEISYDVGLPSIPRREWALSDCLAMLASGATLDLPNEEIQLFKKEMAQEAAA